MNHDWTYRQGHLAKIGPLTLFYRTNSPSCWGIASWHHPNSITWRWLFDVKWHREGRLFRRIAWKTHRQAGLNLWKVEFYIAWQRPMWMRGTPQNERTRREIEGA